MKSGTKIKSGARAGKKTRARGRRKKHKAIDRKTVRKGKAANRDNTLANWVAGMELKKGKTAHRGNTLANWAREAP